MLRVIIFNVKHGFCGFVHTPSGHGIMIDCGKSDVFSPAKFINEQYESYGRFLTRINGHKLTKLVITHPHEDHIKDIDYINRFLRPFTLYGMRDISLSEMSDNPSHIHRCYINLQNVYSYRISESINYGVEINHINLTKREVESIGGNINNSSILTHIRYNTWGRSWTILFSGDIETRGWDLILSKPWYRELLSDVNVFITPHHGHVSGFSKAFFNNLKQPPLINIASITDRDPHVYTGYTKYAQQLSFSTVFKTELRSFLTTRHDGHIVLDIDNDGRYNLYSASTLYKDNLI